ncbi:hypothetical protein [uncultured Nocardioides sp.]|uniref:hypothetical protein n=1 Tax=uncultured Nocardioides sp. TaxID=198441 RepID=UPI0026126BDE|nr:hypothetical protein [uncultured Nocardioides sp.]
MSRSLGSRAVLVVAAVVLLAGCSTGSTGTPGPDAGTGRGDVDPRPAARIADVGIPLHLPELRGSSAGATVVDGVRRGDPAVRTEFSGIEDPVVGDDTWTLAQKPTPARVSAALDGGGATALCRALRWEDEDYGCDGGEDYAVVDYEGDTTVALVRGPALLLANVETESDPEILGQTVTALRDAPTVSADDLSRPPR